MNQEAPHETPEVLSPASAFTPQMLLLTSFVLAILGLVVGLLFRRRSLRSKQTGLLLLGVPDAGKTSLMTTLAYNQCLPTLTSMQTNSSVYSPSPNKNFRVIDVPGHPRIRGQYQEYLADTKAIAFVVDASTVSRNGAAVAEHLHEILHTITSLPPSQSPPSLLVVAHKADLLKTVWSATQQEPLAVNRVKTILERELEKRRASQSGGVGIEGLGAEDEKAEMGGLECGDGTGTFKFDDWEGGEISFVSTYIRPGKASGEDEKEDGEDGLSDLRDWLANNM